LKKNLITVNVDNRPCTVISSTPKSIYCSIQAGNLTSATNYQGGSGVRLDEFDLTNNHGARYPSTLKSYIESGRTN